MQVIKQKRNSKFWNSSFPNHIWKDLSWTSKTRALMLGKRKYKYWGVLALKTEQTDINDFVKSVLIWSFSDPYLVQMWENTDQKDSECGHYSRSAILVKKNWSMQKIVKLHVKSFINIFLTTYLRWDSNFSEDDLTELSIWEY